MQAVPSEFCDSLQETRNWIKALRPWKGQLACGFLLKFVSFSQRKARQISRHSRDKADCVTLFPATSSNNSKLVASTFDICHRSRRSVRPLFGTRTPLISSQAPRTHVEDSMALSGKHSAMLSAATCAAAVVFFSLSARVPALVAFVSLSLFCLLTTLGAAVLGRLAPEQLTGFQRLAFGGVLGLMLGRLALATAYISFGPGFLTSVVVVAMLTLVAIWLHIATPRMRWLDDDTAELNVWLIASSALLVLASGPFAHIADPTNDGFAFVRYFNFDFLHHAAIAAELSRSVPPVNIYFAGEPMHYYWFSHTLPSAIKQLTGVTGIAALSSVLPLNVLLFTGALLGTARVYLPLRQTRVAAVAVGLFSYSYVGFLFFLRELGPAQFRTLLPDYTLLSHSWFRDFLFEPHALTALTLCLFALFVMTDWSDSQTTRSRILFGMVLGLAMVTDSFVGGVLALWVSALCLWRALKAGSITSLIPWLTSAAVALALVGFAYAIQLLPPGQQPMVLRIHSVAKIAPAYLIAELGPIFLLGAMGLFLAWRSRTKHLDALVILLGVSLFISFFVQLPVDDVIALRKATKVVQIPLVIASGFFLLWAWPKQRWIRWTAVAVACSGLVSLASDLAFLCRVVPVPSGTTVVSKHEFAAYDWIRKSTPSDAVIQVFGAARPGQTIRSTMSVVPTSLTERRALFANYEHPYLLLVDEDSLNRRLRVLENLFTARGADAARLIAELPPHYLIVDESQGLDLTGVRDLERSGVLVTVFSSGPVSVLYYAGIPARQTY